jgi:CYTH domain-containing protein
VIDNSTDFDTKIQRLFAEALAVIGDPVPVEKERKFLVKKISPDQVTVPYAISRITQTYLLTDAPGESARVRMRESDGGVSYYHTVKKWIKPGEKYESERIIHERDYLALLENCDHSRSTVVKDRVCFFWNDEFFELDLFVEPTTSDLVGGDIALLEVERLVHGEIQWPDFIENPVEVTDDRRYSNDQIALCKNG